jgi:PAS domain S-box-containing protein
LLAQHLPFVFQALFFGYLMGLRRILIILCLLAFLSALGGGLLYYSALRQAAFKEAERQAVGKAELIHKSIASLLSEHHHTVITLSGMPPVREALITDSPRAINRVNAALDHFADSLEADVCYLMNREGITIASSNRMDPDSFVGQSFAFRPYFREAIGGAHGAYLALGVTSGKRGVYQSYPVYSNPAKPPVGVAVIKSSIEKGELELGLLADDIVLITDPAGVIFISNRPEWLLQLAWQKTPEEILAIKEERQFGPGPWRWVGLQQTDDLHVNDDQDRRYIIHRAPIDRFPDWQILYLRDTEMIAQTISDPFLRIARPAVVLVSVLVGLAVLLLYTKANQNISRRLQAELSLRFSENRYRSLYHHTPAMLHSIDVNGNLLSASDFWLDTMGYSRQEVLGRPLTDFLVPASKQFAENVGIPSFLKYGTVKDLSYRMIKSNGETIDVLLSAIADRDGDGRIQRSLAVCIDVTERNRATEDLRIAKEKLSRHSRDLERQVRERTSEITAILKYTPAVVYMKDAQGRYLLVNSKFEQVFNVSADSVRGKADADLLPIRVADQFRTNDEKVLASGESLQLEETIPLPEGVHTFLSIKFPIYNESGKLQGVCGIATDITALKIAQEQLRRLSASIMANQENERTAIARELHDELGQLLTALRMDAVWLQKRLKDKDDRAAERAAAVCTLVDTTIEEVRSMAIRLRPGVLDDLGLVDALEWYTTEFERRAQIACIFNNDAIPPVNAAISTAAYRIAQEALTNVARHANATRSNVALRRNHDALVLTVSDDGCGFVLPALDETQLLGLVGMRERAALVGGKLQVESQPGRGTRVVFTVPLSDGSAT